MVQVEQELVVQSLDVFERRDDALEVLVLSTPVDRVVDHDSIDLLVLVGLEASDQSSTHLSFLSSHLQNSLLDVDPDSFPVHAFSGIAHEPQLKVDTNLLARFLGELGISRRPSFSILFLSQDPSLTSAYVRASSLSVARMPTRCGARSAKRGEEMVLISSVLNGTCTLDAVIWIP